ncbi:methyltransferase domain-containing protein [Streptomyces albidoflavus]|uniref:methyltransferase domain-containing protein n=1 Tax=Streptomyces albidoflavus TaxID=1886 RepID=UPI0002494426
MSDTRTTPAATAALDAFAASPGDGEEAFGRLAAALWDEGAARPGAREAIPLLVAALQGTPPGKQARLALLLGLLAETGDEAHEAARQGLGEVLALLPAAVSAEPSLTASLLYLLAHFPEDRERIRPAVDGLALDADERTRLERCLTTYAAADAATRWHLGRVFPSPGVWAVTDKERKTEPGLREWLGLPEERAAVLWDTETRALLAYAGARALWAGRHGSPVSPFAGPGEEPATAPARPVGALLDGHAGALRCPACEGVLHAEDGHARCGGCSRAYPLADGVLDLCEEPDGPADPLLAGRYERGLRAGFVRIMGANWGGEITPSDEDAYLTERVRPAAGPVLDLAAGAGRWTRVLARALGQERVIALDVSAGMLGQLRRKLPGVLAVRGSAQRLPFGDSSLAAVNCWNALQALPDPQEAVREVGRCLRSGGTFTLMTFRESTDPLNRYFQSRLQQQARRGAFTPEQLTAWLEASGMKVTDLSGPGTFLFATAVKA